MVMAAGSPQGEAGAGHVFEDDANVPERRKELLLNLGFRVKG